MGYFDYEQYDDTTLASIRQQRAGSLRAELVHGYIRPAEARGDQQTAETYRQELLDMESEYHRVYRGAVSRDEKIADMRRWDARLDELRTARED